MAWIPMLEGAAADEVRGVLLEIANDIDRAGLTEAQPADTALFWAYAAYVLDSTANSARYDAAVSRLIAHIENGIPSIALHGGLAGAGWVMSHVGDPRGDGLTLIDAVLCDVLDIERWDASYDLISGLAGLGVYFLERLSDTGDPTAACSLARVIDHLERTAEIGDAGTTWLTQRNSLPAWQRERTPAGNYNCGVAHGIPGVVAMLGRVAAAAGVADAVRARARALCLNTIRWLRAHMLSPNPRGRFPAILANGHPGEPSRTAWCYGDLGVATALWSAAARLGEPVDTWRDVACEAAQRRFELCHVRDAGLCHGAIGVAHLCNRCYQASGNPVFRAAAQRWFREGLAMRNPGEGIAGFTAIVWPDGGRTFARIPTQSLLEGAAGIGLALVSAVSCHEPGWDRVLACDIPPR